MNTHKGFPYQGYHPTHWLFGGLVALAAGVALFQEQPWGWPMAVAGGIAVFLATMTSHKPVDPGCWIAFGLTAMVGLMPVLLDDRVTMAVSWTLTALGVGLQTVNFMYDAPGITDRGITAFLSVATAVAFGVFTVLALGDMFPPLRWIVWLLGGPLAGMLFGRFAKTEAR